jgi:hypothetical protein
MCRVINDLRAGTPVAKSLAVPTAQIYRADISPRGRGAEAAPAAPVALLKPFLDGALIDRRPAA